MMKDSQEKFESVLTWLKSRSYVRNVSVDESGEELSAEIIAERFTNHLVWRINAGYCELDECTLVRTGDDHAIRYRVTYVPNPRIEPSP